MLGHNVVPVKRPCGTRVCAGRNRQDELMRRVTTRQERPEATRRELLRRRAMQAPRTAEAADRAIGIRSPSLWSSPDLASCVGERLVHVVGLIPLARKHEAPLRYSRCFVEP
jgi:hypothetical protein